MSGVPPLRHLGRLRLVAVGINSVVGGGIFILPATVAALVGPASLAAYLVAGAVVLGVGSALARLASRFDASGGPYLYIRKTFGPFAGFQIGWLFCLARLTAMANLLHAFALYIGALVPSLAHPAGRTMLVLSCTAVVVGVNIRGIRQTSGATTLLVLAKVAPLVVLGIAGLFFMRADNFTPTPFQPADFLRATLLLLFAFSGFEILTVPAEESLRPRRDMPFALFATILMVCGLYLLVHTVSTGILPDLGRQTAPLAGVAAVVAGAPGRYGMTAVAAVSIAGCSLASLLGATRLLYALSSARQIPSWIGSLHPRLRTPMLASLLVGGLAALLAILGGYAFLAAVSSGARLLTYFACCLACLRPALGGRGAARIGAAVTAVAILVLLSGLEQREAIFGMIGIGVGMVLYLFARRGRSDGVPQEERT